MQLRLNPIQSILYPSITQNKICFEGMAQQSVDPHHHKVRSHPGSHHIHLLVITVQTPSFRRRMKRVGPFAGHKTRERACSADKQVWDVDTPLLHSSAERTTIVNWHPYQSSTHPVTLARDMKVRGGYIQVWKCNV